MTKRLIAVLLLLSAVAFGACGDGYSYSKSITVAAGKVTGTLTSFPVYFAGDAALKTVANGGRVQSSSALDVIFCDAASGGNQLPHELVSGTYSATTGAGEWWFKASATAGSVAGYVFYGNASATDTSSAAAVWSNGYTGVFHNGTASALSVTNSLGTNNGTNHSATATTGQIQGGAAITGGSYVDVGSSLVSTLTARTFELWAKGTTFPNAYNSALSMAESGGTFTILVKSNAKLAVYVQGASGASSYDGTGTATLSTGTMYHLAATYASGTGLVGYVNGAQDGTGADKGNLFNGSNTDIWYGSHPTITGRAWNGVLDEVRVSSVARSAAWIAAEYNNQSSPSTFYTLGTEALPALGIGTASLPAGEVGTAYSQTLAATNGATPYTWSISGGGTLAAQGAACAGLALSSGGVISGTPTTAGTCSFTALVTDNVSATATQALSIVVNPAFDFVVQPTVAWVSPSSIAASFQATLAASVLGKCGTASGGPYSITTPEVYTAGYQRTDFTGTASDWGHALAITGLHQNALYYCKVTIKSLAGSTRDSSEFTATTSTLQTMPVTVSGVSAFTRLNDYATGANGLPNTGFWFDGDTEMTTWADDGKFYGGCHDCRGVNGANSAAVGLVEWNAAHTSATQIFASYGPNATYTAPDNSGWHTWGVMAVRGNIYYPMWRCGPNGTGGAWFCHYYTIVRSPDHFAHSIDAAAQAAAGGGPNVTLTAGAKVPTVGAVLPNNASDTAVMFGPIQTCQDERLNCVAQANNDGYYYSWGISHSFALVLSRIRVEDLPLLDGAKWQFYTCNQTGDDGLYDGCWSSDIASARSFSADPMGDLPNSQLIPDFNRFVFLQTTNNTFGGAVVLHDAGPYPWGKLTAIGQKAWSDEKWPDYLPAFGQILPGSYLKISSNPLHARLKIGTSGTIAGEMTTTSTADQYSPFIGYMNLVERTTAVAKRARVAYANERDAHLANGLDVYYDFRGLTNLVSASMKNLAPSDAAGTYDITTDKFVGYPGLYNERGMFQFGHPAWKATLPYGSHFAAYLNPGYDKALTAFTILVAFKHAGGSYFDGTLCPNEMPFSVRNVGIVSCAGDTAGWKLFMGATQSATFALDASSQFQAVAIRWDGSTAKVYNSAGVPVTGGTLTPLTTLNYSGSLNSSPLTIGTGQIPMYGNVFDVAPPYSMYGTISNFLLYSRALTDAELVREMNALRADMKERGVTLP